MRGKGFLQVPFRGINNRLLDDQSIDGLCDTIVNLKPKGDPQNPYWVPFERINNLRNSLGESFTYEFGNQNITNAYYQVRNFIGEYSEDQDASLKRLLVLCQTESRKSIDIVEPGTWEIIKSQSLPLDGNYDFICTRVGEVTVIAVIRNQEPFIIYYLLDDTFIPQGWPEMPSITFTTKVLGFTEEQVLAGQTAGVPRKDVDQYFLVRWAFKLFDGNYVRHSEFFVVKVDAGDITEYVTVEFTHNGYTESLLANEPFWKSLISGVAVFCSLPRDSEKAALNDGVLFETGFWPWIDKLPEDKWPTEDDPNILEIDTPPLQWATFFNLTTDNFTHHRFSARVVDTYNSRLLLGGSSVDFAVPRVPTNAGLDFIDGGPYSNFLTFFNGNYSRTDSYYTNAGVEVAPNEAWDYDVNILNITSRLTPKDGREFKTATIVEENQPTGTLITPNGTTAPSAIYEANLIDDRLVLTLEGIQTSYTDGLVSGDMPFPGFEFSFRVTIGPIGEDADESVVFKVSSNPSAPFWNFSQASIEVGGEPSEDGASIYHIITIKTDSGTYYRIKRQFLESDVTSLQLPEKIFYPDRRAIEYQCVVVNGPSIELALERQLTPHPTANYSYSFLSTAERVYEFGTGTAMSQEPDLNLNLIQQWVRNRVQASLAGQPFVFDLAATYRVGNRENDTILGFGVNLDKTTEGQFGQYPLYVFSDKGAWALEQISDPAIAFGKISPVSNFNGINNTFAIANVGMTICCADNKYIYLIAGNQSKRIDEDIANDESYHLFLKQVHIGYHRANDYEEIVFSNPAFEFTLFYNLSYNYWYKSNEVFRFFFNDFPELLGMNMSNEMKNFADLNINANTEWNLQTRRMFFGEPYQLKRLFPSFVRAIFSQQPSVVNEFEEVNAKLFGYKDNVNIVYKLADLTYEHEKVKDIRFYLKWGPLHSFRLIMNGISTNKGSYLNELDLNLELRHEHRRRIECIGDFFYTDPNNNISLCGHSDDLPGRVVQIYENPVSSILLDHNLGKYVPIMVTDLEGYVIVPTIKYDNENIVRIWLEPAAPCIVLSGLSESYFPFEQPVPASFVEINHNLGKKAGVFFTDMNGYVITLAVKHVDNTTVEVFAEEETAFKAYFH